MPAGPTQPVIGLAFAPLGGGAEVVVVVPVSCPLRRLACRLVVVVSVVAVVEGDDVLVVAGRRS